MTIKYFPHLLGLLHKEPFSCVRIAVVLLKDSKMWTEIRKSQLNYVDLEKIMEANAARERPSKTEMAIKSSMAMTLGYRVRSKLGMDSKLRTMYGSERSKGEKSCNAGSLFKRVAMNIMDPATNIKYTWWTT